MEWLVWIGIFALGAGQAATWRKLNKMEEHLLVFRTRQGKIASQRVSTANPQVDSHARTTVRDTPDLPATARISTGVHRKKRDFDRLTHDS